MFCDAWCRALCFWQCFLFVFLVQSYGVLTYSHFRNKRSGGYPKFPPMEECGSRYVHWSPEREPRVVGGEIPPRGAVPWQVELRQRSTGTHQCGGALISRRLVITAAHCYTDGLIAVAGTTRGALDDDLVNTYSEEQIIPVESGIKHPEFRQSGPYSHDIAVLLLSGKGFRISRYVRPACFSGTTPPPGTWCEVSGWGATDPFVPDKLSDVLRTAAVPLLSMDTCRKEGVYGGQFRRQPILDTMICAGHLKGGVDACGGDSGGPLVCQNISNGRAQLVGIVSWGDGCARRDRPGVYTRVASYQQWIEETGDDLLRGSESS